MTYLEGFVNILNSDLLLGGRILPGEAGCGPVAIKGSYIVVKIDSDSFKQKVINTIYQSGQVRCISDYIVVSDRIILVCEMKSNNENNMKVQLRNTGKFIKYLISIVQQHASPTMLEPSLKYVCFANSYVNKQTTKGNKLDSISWSEGELFRLPCNASYHLNQFI